MHLVPVNWQVAKAKVTENVLEKNHTKSARKESMLLVRKLKENHTVDHCRCIANDKKLDR